MLANRNISQATRAGLPAEYNSYPTVGIHDPGKANRRESPLPRLGLMPRKSKLICGMTNWNSCMPARPRATREQTNTETALKGLAMPTTQSKTAPCCTPLGSALAGLLMAASPIGRLH